MYASSRGGYDHRYFKLHYEDVSIPDLFQNLDSFSYVYYVSVFAFFAFSSYV